MPQCVTLGQQWQPNSTFRTIAFSSGITLSATSPLMPIAGPPLERPLTLTQLLAVGLETKPDEPALVSNERSWTWRELDNARKASPHTTCARAAARRPRRVAVAQSRRAHRPLSRLPSTPGWSPRRSTIAIKRRRSITRSKSAARSILVAHAERDDDLAASKRRAEAAARPHHATAQGRPPPQPRRAVDEPTQSPEDRAPRLPTPLRRSGLHLFTSGSTGKPKGVTHSTKRSAG